MTCVGVLLSLSITACAAYTLANRRVVIRNNLSIFFFFTTLFNGGMVPWYIICNSLGLRDNIWALIVPNLMFNCFNMFMIRNYILGIPESLMESALIDGAGDFTIAFKIYFPICMPVLAAVSLFIAIGYWNDWWNAIMLIDNKNLYPLQYFLFNIQSQIQMVKDLESTAGLSNIKLPNESFKMATVVVTIGPIILLYPFLQRYFVKGLIIGAVKG
jgi:putative aldouronate transport system permease protein